MGRRGAAPCQPCNVGTAHRLQPSPAARLVMPPEKHSWGKKCCEVLGRERAAKRANAKTGGSRRCIAISTAAHHTRANGYTQGNGGLWRIHTTARLPEGLQPMENSCQSRGNMRERRSSKEKPSLNDWTPVTLQNPSCCLGHGEKLSLGTGGGKVVLMFIFLFPTTQISSYISLHWQ